MITLRIEEILNEKRISKAEFARMMNVKKQNVNLLLNSNNIFKLVEIAKALNVELTDLWIDNEITERKLNGFVEYNSQIHKIKTIGDLTNLIELVQHDILNQNNNESK